MIANYLTICFYEHPAAKPHIQMWENLMINQKRIIKIENNEESVNAYYIKTNNDIELLVTIGTFMLDQYSVHEYINSKFEFDKFLKILMFGKLNSNDLEHIIKINNRFLHI